MGYSIKKPTSREEKPAESKMVNTTGIADYYFRVAFSPFAANINSKCARAFFVSVSLYLINPKSFQNS